MRHFAARSGTVSFLYQYCCITIVSLWWHSWDTIVWHCVALLWHSCDTLVTLLWHSHGNCSRRNASFLFQRHATNSRDQIQNQCICDTVAPLHSAALFFGTLRQSDAALCGTLRHSPALCGTSQHCVTFLYHSCITLAPLLYQCCGSRVALLWHSCGTLVACL